MANYLENMNFPGYSFNVIGVVNLPFLENLDGNFLTSEDVVTLFDLTKGALA